jgi:hypothetical protein
VDFAREAFIRSEKIPDGSSDADSPNAESAFVSFCALNLETVAYLSRHGPARA